MELQSRQILVTKDIYPILSQKFHAKPGNVEQDIRTIVNVTWKFHRRRLEELAGYRLITRPSKSEYIDILAFYLTTMKEFDRMPKQLKEI